MQSNTFSTFSQILNDVVQQLSCGLMFTAFELTSVRIQGNVQDDDKDDELLNSKIRSSSETTKRFQKLALV